MILLEVHNKIIYEKMAQAFSSTDEKGDNVTEEIADLDGVLYHITSSKKEGYFVLSISMNGYAQLVKFGAEEVLRREYGPYIVDPEVGYNFSICLNQADLPPTEEERDALYKKFSLLKRNLLAAPFEKAFIAQENKETTEIMEIPYRNNESIFVFALQDHVTVIFSTEFKEDTDKIFGRVFLQEFADARRQPAVQTAPQVLFSKEPPLELRNLTTLRDSEDINYVTFVLFPRHYTEGPVREQTISNIPLFRDYLHYHIKCSKAYMHSRMRARVDSFLKVLNRAKPEVALDQIEKKTASGRTFKKFK
ncbi:P34-Arc-domain-containing protein [Neocallimastix lanati (nom. inval.)]|jgi:actin related protein 2/3 complex subunit 2|uniref:Arp2/3 complex 34 kDa subunit n=1 Tax=Neocallimastix californiae TaxID=1754190 RepID=A0A1Y2EEL8_9FUNG|nr:P34-Arc-domain-containing protein [Neocallimastix sp. JGI-2020a]ORY69245.1 P34-Arc-domain-containing protein [Neocallimastix californiae]|eukprot:ORY69245.1 P34-Arc-domain-containing protein [Neocallimastix californiae]